MFRRKANDDQTPVIKINGNLATELSRPNQIPRLQPLQFQMLDENATQTTIMTPLASQKNTSSSRIKLRDYLFLAQTSATKNASEKRKILQNISNDRNKKQSQKQQPNMRQSGSFLKKNKYGIKNSEMFEILKKQIQVQLKQSMEQINKFCIDLKQQIKGSVIPSSAEMMMMYKVRTLMKDKMKNCIKEMKEALQQEKTQRDQGVQIEILLDEQQLGRDIGFTQEMFNKKYMQLQKKQNTK